MIVRKRMTYAQYTAMRKNFPECKVFKGTVKIFQERLRFGKVVASLKRLYGKQAKIEFDSGYENMSVDMTDKPCLRKRRIK